MDTLRKLIMPAFDGNLSDLVPHASLSISGDKLKLSILEEHGDFKAIALPLDLEAKANPVPFEELKSAFLELLDLTGCEQERFLILAKKIDL